MLKSYIRAEDVVNIRHNIPYNLPKYPIVKEKISIRREFSSKNIVEKILSRNIRVKKNYIRNSSDTQSGVDNNTT